MLKNLISLKIHSCFILIAALMVSCSSTGAKSNVSVLKAPVAVDKGIKPPYIVLNKKSYPVPMVASWYGPGFQGNLTASGEVYDMNTLTAAHKTLPFGTILNVSNPETGKKTTVVINDRGPFIDGRDLDLSYKAASILGVVGPGTARVMVSYAGRDKRYKKYIKVANLNDGPYTIQVASFSQEQNALRLKKSLEFEYKEVYLRNAKVQGKQVYRVRIGKFGKRANALGLAQTLANVGYDTIVIKYDS